MRLGRPIGRPDRVPCSPGLGVGLTMAIPAKSTRFSLAHWLNFSHGFRVTMNPMDWLLTKNQRRVLLGKRRWLITEHGERI
jgi:hypothetical protein